MVIKNVNLATTPACNCGSWLMHWRRFGTPAKAFIQKQA